MRYPHFILLCTLSPLALGKLCPIQGPAFPAPKDVASSSSFTQAKNQLLSTLDKAVHASNASEVTGIDPDSISFSLQVFNTKSDQPLLEPTPPEDDEYVAWNPRSGMLLFESPLSREPGPMPMDEGPNVDSAARGATSDGLSSPSDQLSNVSPSSSGSPGSSGDMDCDLNSWLESGIETTGRS